MLLTELANLEPADEALAGQKRYACSEVRTSLNSFSLCSVWLFGHRKLIPSLIPRCQHFLSHHFALDGAQCALPCEA